MVGTKSNKSNELNYQSKFGVWEIKMMVLLGFIFITLLIGSYASHFKATELVMDRPEPVFWRLIQTPSLKDLLGVTFKEPWELTEQDLTLSRVLYNVLTKPGFRWLAVEVLAGMVASWMFIRGLSWAIAWQWRQWSRVIAAANKVAHATVTINIAGTVEIVAKNGVIYASAVSDGTTENHETFAFYLATVKISIEEG